MCCHLRGGAVPSVLSALGAESLRPWLPQRSSCPQPSGEHLGAGRLPLRLASTFRPAQYKPAAAGAGAGPGRCRQRGGETMWPRWRWLPGHRAPGRDQAARKKGAARRLFVLGLTSPALRLLPMRSVRATGVVRVSVSVLVCVCAGLVRLLLGLAGRARPLQRSP